MNTELTCAQCRDALPEYVAGSLTLAASTAVTRHLAHCTACQDELAGWQRIAMLAQQADERIPTGGPVTTSAIWKAIQTQLPTEPLFVPGERFMDFDHRDTNADLVVTSGAATARREPPPRRPRMAFLAPVAVLLLIALVAGVFALHPTRKNVAPGNSSKTATNIPPTSAPALGISNIQYTGAAIFSFTDIWAVGYGSIAKPGVTKPTGPTDFITTAAILHYTGGQWHTDSGMLYPYAELHAISMVSPNEGWAVGVRGNNENPMDGYSTHWEPFMLHYTGGHWIDVPSSNPNVSLNQVQMFSADDGWAFGGTPTTSIILHYTNGAWQRSNFAPATSRTSALALTRSPAAPMSYKLPAGAPRPAAIPVLEQAAMLSDTQGYAIGEYQNQSVLWHYADGAWSDVQHVSFADTQYTSVGINGANDVWILADKGRGDSFMIHYNGQTGTTQPLNAAAEYPLLGGAEWLKVIGDTGFKGEQVVTELLHEQGGKWVPTALPNPHGYQGIIAIAPQSDGSTLALALASQQANGVGATEYGSPYLLRYVNGKWTAVG